MPNAFCFRCRQFGYVTKSKATTGTIRGDGVPDEVEEDVRLCGPCRSKAKVENDTAKKREGLGNPR